MSKPFSTLTVLLLIIVLLVPPLARSEESADQSEQILNQELALNQLMTSIHVLQLDFMDRFTREKLQEQLVQLDANFNHWPKDSKDKESNDLLLTVKSLWPVVHRHIQWLVKLPEQPRAPDVTPLLRALGKLDRQLMLLRQKHLSHINCRQPEIPLS